MADPNDLPVFGVADGGANSVPAVRLVDGLGLPLTPAKAAAVGDAVSSFATVLDAGPWVALQRAADTSRNIIIDTPIALGDATIRLRSGTTIRAATKQCVLTKTTTGTLSKTKPAFYLEDVSDITFQGIQYDFTFAQARELFLQMVSTSPLGLTRNIKLIDCDLRGGGWHAARWCSNISMIRGSIDGKGTAANPSAGSLACLSTGGSFDLATGTGANLDGVVSGIWLSDVDLHGCRQEAVDINWATQNVYIDKCDIWDYGLDGTLNEAIDVGGGSGANICANIFITRTTIRNDNAGIHASGIKIKLGTDNFLVQGNFLFSAAAADSGDGITFGDAYGNGKCIENEIWGFKTSINAGTPAVGALLTIKNNRCFFPYTDGVSAFGVTNVEVVGNTVRANNSIGRGLHLQSCVGYVAKNNAVLGAWSQQARFDSASSGTQFGNEYLGTGSIADASAKSGTAAQMLAYLGGFSSAGGTLMGNLTVQGTAMTQTRYSDDSGSPQIIGRKYRGTSAAPTVIAANDPALTLIAAAYDGTTSRSVAQIVSRVTAATPSATDMRSRLEFDAVPSGSGSLSTAMLIDHYVGLSLFGSAVVDPNRHLIARPYLRSGLPTATASNVGMARVTNPEAGKSPLVYNTGSVWVYVGDNSTVTIA